MSQNVVDLGAYKRKKNPKRYQQSRLSSRESLMAKYWKSHFKESADDFGDRMQRIKSSLENQ